MRVCSRVLAGAVAAAFLTLAAVPASADCDPNNALFEDDFEFMDVSWGDPAEDFFVEDGALVVKTWWEQVNFSTLNEGANVCMDITIVEAPNVGYSPVGTIFWWQDWDNYYYLWYWADGGLEVRRIFKGQSSTLFTMETLALKKGVGETNHIELRLKAKDATVIVNGTEVKRFKGIQPKGGGVVGITASSPEDAPGIFKFDNFIVSAPE
jgi:hypothetical protein